MHGTVLDGRYRLEALLGNGGMGAVWSARDERLDRQVAVKLIRNPLGGADSTLNARFRQEARLTARMLGHPHIVAVLDYGFQLDPHGTQTPFVVMELIQGRSLRDVLADSARPSPAQALEWCAQICDALATAHGARIVHRDIKPDNILLVNGNSTVKVVDFGIAAYADPQRTRLTFDGEVVGSVHYMAPERVGTSHQVDARSDLYSVGCLLHELLTGQPPFTAADTLGILFAHAHTQPEPPGISRALDDLVLRLLAKQPDARPADAATTRDLLRGLAAESAPTTVPAPAPDEHADLVQLYANLAADYERVLGPDHPDTLAARHDHAWSLGESGERAQAAGLFLRLAADRERILGRDHPDALNARDQHAWNLGESGDRAQAASLFLFLVPDYERVLGAYHDRTLTARHNHAWSLGLAGQHAESVRLFVGVIADRERALGPDHPHTLSSRSEHAWSVHNTGQHGEAAWLYTRLLADRARVLGPDHPDTLLTRHSRAWCTAAVGTPSHCEEAAALFAQVAADQARVLGPDHPHTLTSRHNQAWSLGLAGRHAEAASLFPRIIADRERVLGPDHPHTLSSRREYALNLGKARG